MRSPAESARNFEPIAAAADSPDELQMRPRDFGVLNDAVAGGAVELHGHLQQKMAAVTMQGLKMWAEQQAAAVRYHSKAAEGEEWHANELRVSPAGVGSLDWEDV